jgi:very-short-patch-repair endonuclease
MRGETQPRRIDRRISGLAERQHGVVGRVQLARLGMLDGAIDWRVDIGRLHVVHRGVYAVGHAALTPRARWMAAVLTCGPSAVLSHRSAAALWRIRPLGSGGIEVTLRPKSHSPPGIRRHASKLLPEDEVTVEDGIPVTTVPRTILDLAAIASVDVVENALREAEYLRLYDTLSLQDLVARYPGRRGIRKVRASLDRLKEEPNGRRRSPLEERFVPFLRRHHLPIPRLNAWLEVGGRRYQVDCHWPGTTQIVELDGWQGHGTRSAFREDRARDRRLRVAGYAVTRLAWSQLDDEPAAIAADLRSLLQDSA